MGSWLHKEILANTAFYNIFKAFFFQRKVKTWLIHAQLSVKPHSLNINLLKYLFF